MNDARFDARNKMNIEAIRNREQLQQTIDAGNQVQYLFFWGHRPSSDGRITQSCFSQWFESSFEVEGKIYPTAEHFMMAKKAALFKDTEAESRILSEPDPAKAKALGRTIRNFVDEVWLEHRWNIVVEANFHKFTQNPLLKNFILSTSPRILVEASPLDEIWGIGFDARASEAANPAQWKGLNLLGFALMEVRSTLMQSK